MSKKDAIHWMVQHHDGSFAYLSNHRRKIDAIQHFLHCIRPNLYPPTNGGNTFLVGHNPKEVWKSLEEKGCRAVRVRIHAIDENLAEDAEIIGTESDDSRSNSTSSSFTDTVDSSVAESVSDKNSSCNRETVTVEEEQEKGKNPSANVDEDYNDEDENSKLTPDG